MMSTRRGYFKDLGMARWCAIATVSQTFVSLHCLAQITPDGTLPNNSNVKLEGNTRIIEGGTTAGSNLFHSFSEFSVPTGTQAFFNNAGDIQNIINRVTGSSASNIDGLIRANGTANLFLINPNGIIFGPNASLNIGGSFLGSTANSIKFADGFEFSTKAAQSTPLLTISVPLGLQFGANPGKIQVQGDGQGIRTTSQLIDTQAGLRVQPNQTLALVGGDLSLEGATLKTAGGRIELGSVGGEGTVSLTPTNKSFSLGYGGVQNFGNIELSQQAVVDASGAGGGDVQVTARRVTLQGGSQIEASTLLSEPGGTLAVNASESVEVFGTSVNGEFPSGFGVVVYPRATGDGGNLEIQTGNLLVQNGAEVVARTYGTGKGGNINVTSGSVSLTDGAQLDATTFGLGAAGNLTIQTGTLQVENGAEVRANTYGAGKGGNLNVQADRVQLFSNSRLSVQARENATGKAGNLTIKTGTLQVQGGAQVSASTFGAGNGGNLTVNASEKVELMGISANGRFPSGLYTEQAAQGTGTAGNLIIDTPVLLVQDRAEVRSGTYGEGKGGNINVTSVSVSLTDGARLFASTYGKGDAGSVLVQAKDSVFVAGNSYIFSNVEYGGVGKGGDVNINAATLSLNDGGQLSTSVRGASNNQPLGQGIAGNVNVNVTGAVTIAGVKNGFSSGIFSYLGSGATGKGGNINVNTGSLSLTDGAQLDASTYGKGDAGSVLVQAKDSVSVAGNSYIFSNLENGAVGKGGDVNINAATLSLNDGGQLGTFVRGASNNQPPGQAIAGNVNVNVTGAVTIAGVKNGYSGIFSFLGSGATGKGGNINVNTGSLSLTDGAQLDATTFGTGAAGDLTIKTGVLQVDNGAVVRASTYGAGKGGNLNVQADRVQLFSNSRLSAQAREDATGNAGNLTIKTGTLLVQGGAQVSAGTFGAGNGGNLTVNASEKVELVGISANGRFPSGLYTEQAAQGTGTAGNLTIDTPVLLVKDRALVSASTFGAGAAGDLTIKTGVLQVQEQAQVTSSTFAAGKGGNLTVTAESVQVANAYIRTQANLNATSDAQDLKIQTGTLIVKDGAQVSSGTLGQGNGGNLTVNASDKVEVIGTAANGLPSGFFTQQNTKDATGAAGNMTIDTPVLLVKDGALVSARTAGAGAAGNLTIKTGTLLVQDGAVVSASTFGAGNGGSLTVNASEKVEVTGTIPNGQSGSRLETNTYGTGNAGNLTINTGRLVVKDSQVSASTLDKGNAGNLTVNASESIDLSGVLFGVNDVYPAGLFAQVNSQADGGRGGTLTIETGRLSISNGAKVQVATFGQGDAGNLFIRADEIDIFETPRARYTYFAGGISGGVLTTREATKPPKGNGGSVEIVTNRLTVRDGGRVTTTTEGEGNAGTLRIRASESVEVFGRSPGDQFDSEISAAVTPKSTGNGGSVSIDTGNLIIRDRGTVTVRNERKDGTSFAGDLEINARSINLDKGTLSATTNSGNGGNITLTSQDLLLLRNNSSISTTAGTAQQGGDGGNININSKFIVAVPQENSDITANAYTGKGGEVQINTQGIFGIQFRPQDTLFSDITASSQFGVNGTVQINTPDVDPSRGLVELPIVVVNNPGLIASSCATFADEGGNKFTITGRGGLPSSPDEFLSTDVVWADTRLPTITPRQPTKDTSTKPPSKSQPVAIVPATGWVFNGKGEVTLISTTPNANPLESTPATCPSQR